MSAAGFALAVPAGLLLALGRLRGAWWLRGLILAVVDVVRFTPLLVQAVWIHFALPALTGVSTSVTQSGLLALSLHVSAYVCEIMRAGIVAIPKGQWEAARAMGLRTVAVYSEADRDAMHVAQADAAVFIGPARARDSYLNIETIIAAASCSGIPRLIR